MDDIRFIQERYAWFLDSMFKGVSFEKKKGQRKESLAKQVYLHNLGAFVSGVSLGADSKVDAPQVKTQYRMRGEVQGELPPPVFTDSGRNVLVLQRTGTGARRKDLP